MDRQVIYAGALPLDLDQLQQNRSTLIQFGFLMNAIFCVDHDPLLDGLACTPTNPPTLNVLVGPGAIFSYQDCDGAPYGSLDPDINHSFRKCGINYDYLALPVTPPSLPGNAIAYLVEVQFQEIDTDPVVQPYYNAANPAVPFIGPGNSGVSQATRRREICAVQIKAGNSAPQTTQVPPTPDVGWTPVWIVTVRAGQTSIAQSDISMVTGAPFIADKLCVAAPPTPPPPPPPPTPSPPPPTPTPVPSPPPPTPTPTPPPSPPPPTPVPPPTPTPTPPPPTPVPPPPPPAPSPLNIVRYIGSTGSDTTGDGLTAGTCWATMQHAWDTVRTTINGFGGSCYFIILDTLTQGLVATAPLTGFPTTFIQGSFTTVSPPGPAPTGFNCTEQSCLNFTDCGPVGITTLYFQTQSSTQEASEIKASGNTVLSVYECNFGPCQSHMLQATNGAAIYAIGPQTWTGSTVPVGGYTCESFAEADTNGIINVTGTWNENNDNPVDVIWNTGCAFCFNNGVINFATDVSFANLSGGAFHGPRYHIESGGVVNTNGAGPNFLPGDIAGTNTGGTYQ